MKDNKTPKHIPSTDPKPEKGKDNEHGHKEPHTSTPGRSHASESK